MHVPLLVLVIATLCMAHGYADPTITERRFSPSRMPSRNLYGSAAPTPTPRCLNCYPTSAPTTTQPLTVFGMNTSALQVSSVILFIAVFAFVVSYLGWLRSNGYFAPRKITAAEDPSTHSETGLMSASSDVTRL